MAELDEANPLAGLLRTEDTTPLSVDERQEIRARAISRLRSHSSQRMSVGHVGELVEQMVRNRWEDTWPVMIQGRVALFQERRGWKRPDGKVVESEDEDAEDRAEWEPVAWIEVI